MGPKLTEMTELARLIQEAKKLPPMTDEQRREQAASFAFGQIALTKEWADADADKLIQLRDMCRQLAGCKPRVTRKVAPKPTTSSQRHGREYPGHPDGCRCYPLCDDSR